MQPRDAPGSPGLAGRARESARLGDVVTAAVAGTAGAVLVRGEAGVGKTRLVGEVADRARRAGSTVLWGQCLQLGSVTVPYLPFVTAFEVWLREAAEDERQALTRSVPALAGLVPLLGGAPAASGEHLTTITRALDELAARAPVVLVVDDVQWADETSRDVLAYTLSGLRHQRLAVLLTARVQQLAEGDALLGWFADVRRLPAVSVLDLSRLTPAGCAEQARSALGTEADPALVAELFRRTGGNPYFNELLLREVDPATGRLPERALEGLREALLAMWHRLPPVAREVSRMLAVAGRPTGAGVLGAVAEILGVGDADAVAPGLRDAAVGGVVELGEQAWFRHPLLGELLPDTLLADERAQLHRGFVAAWEAGRAPELLQADLARHYEGAGLYDRAFEACLRAAADAGAVLAHPEQARLMIRAWRLRERVRPDLVAAQGSAVALAIRVVVEARRGGEGAAAAQIAGEARTLLGTEPDPALRGRLLRLYAQLGINRGLDAGADESMAILRDALAEARQAPPGDELAHVLAELSYGHSLRGESDEAVRAGTEAVEAGRVSGDGFALSYALGARSWILQQAGDRDGAQRDAEEAQAVAPASERPEAVALASIAKAQLLLSCGRWPECADVQLSAHLDALQAGLLGLAQVMGADAVVLLCHVGRLDKAEKVARRVLSVRLSGLSAVHSRRAATMLAVRQGRLALADAHQATLRELTGDGGMAMQSVGHSATVEYLLAREGPERALAYVREVIDSVEVQADPADGDALLVWVARAAADLVATRGREAAIAALDELLSRRRALEVPLFAEAEDNPVQAAWQTLFEAESARCRDSADAAQRWEQAVGACAGAGLRFEEARSRLALAQCLIGATETRTQGRDELRAAHHLAGDMGAAALRAAVEALATAARVSLAARPEPVSLGGPGDGLTPREREVLGHVVAGRTYAEVAAALFISEKTVSVHVSNLLRKTGTANRVELAAWALGRSGDRSAGGAVGASWATQ